MNGESRLHIQNNMAPFEEVIGVVKSIEISDSEVSAILTCTYNKSVTVRFPKNTIEAEIIEQKLSKLLGHKVAILRIRDPQNSLRIRKVESKTQKEREDDHGCEKNRKPDDEVKKNG